MAILKINCENLAPITKLSSNISTNGLKLAVFANNGVGKTFISRMFRLTEPNINIEKRQDGSTNIDYLITLKQSNCKFGIKIIDAQSITTEEFDLEIKRGQIPIIPTTKYIYHTFNKDFVEENIATLSYDKDSNIEGFILGKGNIDISKEELKKKELIQKKDELKGKIETNISETILNKTNKLPNMGRIAEYKIIEFQSLRDNTGKPYDVSISYKNAYNNYEKIKNIPDNLPTIPSIINVDYNVKLFEEIKTTLKTKYDLSHFASEFKDKINTKLVFIEDGLKLVRDNKCPFCEQPFDNKAIKLIEQYISFIKNTEAITIKTLKQYILELNKISDKIDYSVNDSNKQSIQFDKYKNDYFPSMDNYSLISINNNSVNAKKIIEEIKESVKSKMNDIRNEIIVNFFTTLTDDINIINNHILKNNEFINQMNSKKLSITAENLESRRTICKVVFNELLASCKEKFTEFTNIEREIEIIEKSITAKQVKNKHEKKIVVVSTIKTILNYFFNDKYTFDETTFRLILNKELLNSHQAKDVLSEGEKNVVAFAYYLGDTHLKIQKVEDYNRLIFVIDDPISSMDFNFVYTVCGIIRKLKNIFPDINQHEKFIILTHNMEFMRILASNQIANKKLILRNNSLSEFNTNFTVPYICHLQDIYRVSQKTANPSHTTANSIRFILETIVRFENCKANDESISKYIDDKFDKDSTTYTLINDLSHGALRTSQNPINEDDYIKICDDLVTVIGKRYPAQIDFCKNS